MKKYTLKIRSLESINLYNLFSTLIKNIKSWSNKKWLKIINHPNYSSNNISMYFNELSWFMFFHSILLEWYNEIEFYFNTSNWNLVISKLMLDWDDEIKNLNRNKKDHYNTLYSEIINHCNFTSNKILIKNLLKK